MKIVQMAHVKANDLTAEDFVHCQKSGMGRECIAVTGFNTEVFIFMFAITNGAINFIFSLK